MTDTKTFDVSSDRFNFGVSAIGPWESVAANNDSTYVVLGEVLQRLPDCLVNLVFIWVAPARRLCMKILE